MGQFLNSREPYDKYRTVILELKVDHTPEEAIAQIKEKEYVDALKDYHGDLLLAGINYSKKTKKHSCVIEKMEK